MKIKKTIFLFAMFFLMTFPLLSQENTPNGEEQASSLSEFSPDTPPLSPLDDNGLYVITAFELDIKGRTRPEALIYNGEFKTGEQLQGGAELEKYIRDKTQVLINQRVLKDNAAIDYIIGEQIENGAYPVTLIIKVEDSWNIIALPRPSYKSDSGFDLTIKARDYNFLGTMEPLRVDLGYKFDEKKNHSVSFLIDSNTPFRAFGYTWHVDFDHLFEYRPNVEKHFYYRNTTGLSMELPILRTTLTFGVEESFNVNEENADSYKERYGDFQEGLYMASKLYTTWEIPTGLMVYRYGELIYNARVSTTFNHELSQWPLADFRKGPFMDFNHSLGFEKIDWHANYRDGLSVSLDNSYNLDFHRLTEDKSPLSLSYSLRGAGHFIISRFFAISTQLQFRHWFHHDPDYYDHAGDVLRGIADKALRADYMLSLNVDFPFRVLLFTPSKWWNNRKLRFLDFEFHTSLVIDLALYHDPETETRFHPKNIAASGGLEFIVFPLSFRSLYIRFGIAYNLRELMTAKPAALPGGDNREIYLLMGHFY